MGDNDFPAMMGNTPIGFVRQFMMGDTKYAQKGDGIPDFATRTNYSQQGGGPLVAQVSLTDRIKNFLGNFNDFEAFKKMEKSDQNIRDMAKQRNREREIEELNKKLRMERGM